MKCLRYRLYIRSDFLVFLPPKPDFQIVAMGHLTEWCCPLNRASSSKYIYTHSAELGSVVSDTS